MRARSAASDPAHLHPGRVALILLRDVGEVDPDVLAAGILAESRDVRLRVTGESAEEVLGARAFRFWERLPELDWTAAPDLPAAEDGDGELLEALVTAEPAVQRIALSEALDQIRHAHLWAGAEERARAARVAGAVLAPAATRVHPVLARRFDWWVRRVANSFRFERK
jgi:hypothetical protein